MVVIIFVSLGNVVDVIVVLVVGSIVVRDSFIGLFTLLVSFTASL